MDAGRTCEKGGADEAAYDVPCGRTGRFIRQPEFRGRSVQGDGALPGSLTHHFYNFP